MYLKWTYFTWECRNDSVKDRKNIFISTFLEINYILLAKYKLDIYLFTKVRMNMSCLDTYPHKNHTYVCGNGTKK